MHIYVDANNMLCHLDRDRAPRQIRWLINEILRKKGNRSITLVFDGNQPPGDYSSYDARLNIVFQDPVIGEADDEIERLVMKEQNKGSVAVVTNDRELRLRVSAVGVHRGNIFSIEEFNKMLNPARTIEPEIDEAEEKEAAIQGIDKDELAQELLQEFTKESR